VRRRGKLLVLDLLLAAHGLRRQAVDQIAQSAQRLAIADRVAVRTEALGVVGDMAVDREFERVGRVARRIRASTPAAAIDVPRQRFERRLVDRLAAREPVAQRVGQRQERRCGYIASGFGGGAGGWRSCTGFGTPPSAWLTLAWTGGGWACGAAGTWALRLPAGLARNRRNWPARFATDCSLLRRPGLRLGLRRWRPAQLSICDRWLLLVGSNPDRRNGLKRYVGVRAIGQLLGQHVLGLDRLALEAVFLLGGGCFVGGARARIGGASGNRVLEAPGKHVVGRAAVVVEAHLRCGALHLGAVAVAFDAGTVAQAGVGRAPIPERIGSNARDAGIRL
jgi:hypothetical protein